METVVHLPSETPDQFALEYNTFVVSVSHFFMAFVIWYKEDVRWEKQQHKKNK